MIRSFKILQNRIFEKYASIFVFINNDVKNTRVQLDTSFFIHLHSK